MKHFAIAAVVTALTAGAAHAATFIDNSTQGLYNAGIGTVLNGTSTAFPEGPPFPIDPTLSFGPGDAPDLTSANAALGDWLTNPAAPGGAWSAAPQAIPGSWTVGTETAIIYAFDGGATGLENLSLSIGVDNGIFVWLNGTFIGGEMRPGPATPNEHVFNLGTVGAGTNYLQLLREDHGGGTGYAISLTGDEMAPIPLPAGLPLLLAGLGALGVLRSRKRGSGQTA
jgi:hypothetical protein